MMNKSLSKKIGLTLLSALLLSSVGCTWIYGTINRTELSSSQKSSPGCDSKLSGVNYGGGSGTAAEPFLICSVEQLNKIGLNSADWSKSFLVTADLDLGSLPANSFNMIGTSAIRFTGVFDGGSKTLSNLSYSTTGKVLGLIAYAGAGAVVKDVSIRNFALSTDSFAGSIVGHATGGLTATNLSGKDVNITCGSGCGGIVGYANGITASGGGLTATAWNTISPDTDSRSNFGGFIGQAVGMNSFLNVSVDKLEMNGGGWITSNVGGLAGQIEGSTVNQISVTGLNILLSSSAGGLVGSIGGTNGVTISNSRVSTAASSSIQGVARVGGLVGEQLSTVPSLSISKSYSYSTVTSTSGFAGGLVGRFYTSVSIDRCAHRASGINSQSASRYGGLVGGQHTAAASGSLTIANSVAEGSWTGAFAGNGGGLVGSVQAGTTVNISNSIAATIVTGTSNVGSLTGTTSGATFNVTNSFYDSTIGPVSESPAGNVINWDAQPTASLKTAATYAGWTDPSWVFVNGSYPKLNFEP